MDHSVTPEDGGCGFLLNVRMRNERKILLKRKNGQGMLEPLSWRIIRVLLIRGYIWFWGSAKETPVSGRQLGDAISEGVNLILHKYTSLSDISQERMIIILG